MAFLNIVLWSLAFVHFLAFGQEIKSHTFLVFQRGFKSTKKKQAWLHFLCCRACFLFPYSDIWPGLLAEGFTVDPEAESGVRNIIDFLSVRQGVITVLQRLRIIAHRCFFVVCRFKPD